MPIAQLRGHTHIQTEAQTVWTINHNMGAKPNCQVSVLNASQQEVILPKSITHPTNNQTVIVFSSARAGSARLI